MHHDPVRVNVKDHQNEVAKTIAKYNLMSVPVVNESNQLQGIVTVDDAIDILLPTAWKKRLPKMF
jgi:magnesium transporter